MITKHHQLKVPLADWCITHSIVERNNVCLCIPLYSFHCRPNGYVWSDGISINIWSRKLVSQFYVCVIVVEQSELFIRFGSWIFYRRERWRCCVMIRNKTLFLRYFSAIHHLWCLPMYTTHTHSTCSTLRLSIPLSKCMCVSFDTWVMVGSYTMRCQMYISIFMHYAAVNE